MFNGYPDVLSVETAAELLTISKNSMYRLVREKRIGSKRVGRKILIPKMCLIAYIRSAQYTVKV